MKKATYLIVLLSLSITVKAQKSAVFKFKYLPKHEYKSTIKMDMDMNMIMGGDSAQIAKLKAEGAPQSMQMSANSTGTTSLITGAPRPNKTFSFDLSYKEFTTKMKMNGADMNAPAPALVGQHFSGDCDAEGNLHVDSVGVKNMDAKVKAALTELMNKMQKQIRFPEKPLAIGDSFDQDIPLNMPMNGMNMDMKMKTTYTLTNIKEGKGYFDMKMAMNMDLNMTKDNGGLQSTGVGGGTGKVIYGIDQNYPVSMVSDMDMALTMDVKTQKIILKMKMKTDMETEIAKVN